MEEERKDEEGCTCLLVSYLTSSLHSYKDHDTQTNKARDPRPQRLSPPLSSYPDPGNPHTRQAQTALLLRGPLPALSFHHRHPPHTSDHAVLASTPIPSSLPFLPPPRHIYTEPFSSSPSPSHPKPFAQETRRAMKYAVLPENTWAPRPHGQLQFFTLSTFTCTVFGKTRNTCFV